MAGVRFQMGTAENPVPPVDISKIAGNLELREDGIWVSRNPSTVSYPEEGNQNCLALEESSFWFEHRNDCILEMVRRYPPAGTIFDLGGGNGYVANGLQQAGFSAALVEPGLNGVENAARRGVNLLICSTLEDARFHNGTLPAVGAFDVLEHIADEETFLAEIYRSLIPGGRFYLTVPAYQGLWSVDDEYAGHYRRYTRKRLSASLARAGFQVEMITYIFFMLPPPIYVFRVLPSRLGLRKRQDWEAYSREHYRRNDLVGQLLRRLLAWEIARLRAGKIVPVGGSCLAVATR
jgi:SAM-dependent methyltransferase